MYIHIFEIHAAVFLIQMISNLSFSKFYKNVKNNHFFYLVNTKLHSIVVWGTGEGFFITSATYSLRLLNFPIDVSLIGTKSHRASFLSWVLDI